MTSAIHDEVLRLRCDVTALRFQRAMLRHMHALRDAKYNPDQPRVPAGRPAGGQWTRPGGGIGFPLLGDSLFEPNQVIGDAEFDPTLAGAQYAQAQVTIDYSGALTGLSTVDNTTRELSQTLARTMGAMDFIPEWTPQIYGTAVHVAFGTAVRFQGIPGIGPRDVEQSFLGGEESENYGVPGSVRTDVVLRNQAGEVIAIYDVKTGGARLTPARVRELRAKTGVAPSTPIIELHVVRGANLKARIRRGGVLGFVIAQLWAESRPSRWHP